MITKTDIQTNEQDQSQTTEENANKASQKAKNQMLLDLITNFEANTFHDRRQQTNYLVGFNDLEPMVSEMIREASVVANKNATYMKEL